MNNYQKTLAYFQDLEKARIQYAYAISSGENLEDALNRISTLFNIEKDEIKSLSGCNY